MDKHAYDPGVILAVLNSLNNLVLFQAEANNKFIRFFYSSPAGGVLADIPRKQFGLR